MTQKVHMGHLTGGEAAEELARNPVILLPMGSHEEQGPHAPMGDYLLAEKMAELIALRATASGTRTLVAPVLPFGGADYFGSKPGGIAIGQATLRAVLVDMFGALLRHGLTRLVVINGHGGNTGPIYDVTRDLHQQRGVVIPSLYLWRIAYGMLPGLVGADLARKVSSHGADPLTSLTMHLFPDRLRPDMVPPPRGPAPQEMGMTLTGWGTASFDGAEIGVPFEYDRTSPTGVGAGDPALCSPETGAKLAEALTALGAKFVATFAAET